MTVLHTVGYRPTVVALHDPGVTPGTCRRDVTTTWRNWWRQRCQLDCAVVGSGRRVIDRRAIDQPQSPRLAAGGPARDTVWRCPRKAVETVACQEFIIRQTSQ